MTLSVLIFVVWIMFELKLIEDVTHGGDQIAMQQPKFVPG